VLLGALTNEIVFVRNAVFTVLMVDSNELSEVPTPSGKTVEIGCPLARMKPLLSTHWAYAPVGAKKEAHTNAHFIKELRNPHNIQILHATCRPALGCD
jgi:hypothetical protein